MFGIDFSEMVVCFVVALVVIGPQRMPEAVRFVGLWVGRLKRSIRETRETIEQQMGMDEVRRQLHTEEMMRTLDDMHDEIETALNYERRGNKTALIEGDALSKPELPSPSENFVSTADQKAATANN